MAQSMLYALGGTGFTFLMTSLGAAVVFFFRKEMKEEYQRVFLGFAAGVMIAASVWSLLIPAIDQAEEMGLIGWIPAAGGFALGGIFLCLMDKLLPHIHANSNTREGLPAKLKRTTMLVFAVTLHNAPEGMAVGVAFAPCSDRRGESGSPCSCCGPCSRNRHPELPGRSGYLTASQTGGAAQVESIFVWQHVGNCGTNSRCAGGYAGNERPGSNAMASGICGRGHDLCSDRGIDPGGKSG